MGLEGLGVDLVGVGGEGGDGARAGGYFGDTSGGSDFGIAAVEGDEFECMAVGPNGAGVMGGDGAVFDGFLIGGGEVIEVVGEDRL